MLTITSITGNIFDDKELMTRFKQMDFQKNCERLKISRIDLERSRIRRKTDQGTDIGLALDSGTILHHGDVILSDPEKFIVIEQLPEKVLSIKIEKLKENPSVLLTLGHIIGNRHKPISINENTISFPIQTDSEVDVFQKLFSGVIEEPEIQVKDQIFQPQHGTYIHEH